MKTAVITDIHGNIEALEAVLADCHAQGVDEVIALGDLVGYGHDPEAVIQLLMARNIPSVMGNHEVAFMDDAYLKSFNPEAAKAIRLHRKWLSSESKDYIARLPRAMVMHGARFVHGLPPDSVTDYVSRTPEKRVYRMMMLLKQSISFTGHTHLMSWLEIDSDRSGEKMPQKEFAVDGNFFNRGRFEPAEPPDSLRLKKGCRYLISAGSVGQPRDGVWMAKYVIWDPSEKRVLPRYVVYDNHQAARRIEKRGLPKRFSAKLL